MIRNFSGSAAGTVGNLEDLNSLGRPFCTLFQIQDAEDRAFFLLFGSLTGEGVASDGPVIVAERFAEIEPANLALGKWTGKLSGDDRACLPVNLTEDCLHDLLDHIDRTGLLQNHDLPPAVFESSGIPETIFVMGTISENLGLER